MQAIGHLRERTDEKFERVDDKFTSAEKLVVEKFTSAEKLVVEKFASADKSMDTKLASLSERSDTKFKVVIGLLVGILGTVVGGLALGVLTRPVPREESPILPVPLLMPPVVAKVAEPASQGWFGRRSPPG